MRNTHIERLNVFSKYTSIYSHFILGIAVTYIGLIEIIPLLMNFEDMFIQDIVTDAVLWSCLLFIIVFWGNLNYKNWFGQFIIAVAHVGAFFILNGLIIKKDEAFPVFPMVTIFGWTLVVLMALGLLFNLFNLLFFFPIIRNYQNESSQEWLENIKTTLMRNKTKLIAGLVISGLLGSAALVVNSDLVWNEPIVITPQDYQAKIGFWGSVNTDIYSAEEKESLDNHSAIIMTYDTPTVITGPGYTGDYVINHLTTWNNSYPNVKFMPAIPSPELHMLRT